MPAGYKIILEKWVVLNTSYAKAIIIIIIIRLCIGH